MWDFLVGGLNQVEEPARRAGLWRVDGQVRDGKSRRVAARALRDNSKSAAQVTAGLQAKLLHAIDEYSELPAFCPNRNPVTSW